MSKRQLLCLLGAWVMLFLFLGLPSSWLKVIAVVSGLVIIFISYNLPHQARENNSENNNHTPNI